MIQTIALKARANQTMAVRAERVDMRWGKEARGERL
jgi:hypothetical protein